MQLKQRKAASSSSAAQARFAREGKNSWQQGVALANAGDWARAEKAFRRASEANPRDTVYLLNLARAQRRNGDLDGALASAQKVLALSPDESIAWTIAADCLNQQHRYAEAASHLQRQPAQGPRSAEYYQNLGEALFNADQYQEAISALFQALALNIDHALSHYRLGLSFNALGMKQEATECFRTALLLGLGSGNLAAQGLLAFVERELCRWDHANEDVAALQRMAAELPPDAASWASVFAQVTLTDNADEQRKAAASCARFQARGIKPFAPIAPRPLPARLRVGFVSADFHQHATAILMAEVFEKMDRTRFEITLYSHGPDDNSPMRQRLKDGTDHFVEVSKAGDLEVAQRVRRDEIDLLVDLKGHTRDTRLALFAYRPAPVQVTFLGFPGTTGADHIDYFIGDEIVSPLSHASHYSEKLALMPRCYQPNDQQRALPGTYTRAMAGLPEDALVLCGFNQPFKLSPEVFDVWCRLLKQLPNSVLWLLQWNEHSPAQLKREAEARGIAAERLVFAPKVGAREHMSRLALSDVFIDTWPCNGHTTVSDALWAGVPVVTYAGQTFASRVAASLLHAVGTPEFACDTLPDYEARVMHLATDAAARRKVHEHLVQARDTAPLFDSVGYTRDFENLLWNLADRWSRGLPVDHVVGASVTESAHGETA